MEQLPNGLVYSQDQCLPQVWHPARKMGKSLTVLLEKEFDSVFFDKLRAIILFEADFNWIQKIIFSNKMANLAKKRNLISTE